MRKGYLWVAAAACLAAAGCAALVVGAGVGAGAFSYIQGELVRPYAARYADVLNTCSQTLQDLGMPTNDQSSDGVQTVINSQRKDGTPVTVKVRIAALDVTEVSVRTGQVGVWDREFSQQFHGFIAERLRP
jgi:hypothetical protein